MFYKIYIGQCNTICIVSDEEGETVAKKRRKLSDSNVAHEEKLVKYRASLTVYDRNCRCQLVDGNYEVALREVSTNSQNVLRKSTWEIINDSKVNIIREM